MPLQPGSSGKTLGWHVGDSKIESQKSQKKGRCLSKDNIIIFKKKVTTLCLIILYICIIIF